MTARDRKLPTTPAPPPRFEMLTIAMIGESLPAGPAREAFEALTDAERMRIDLRNPRWRCIMDALGPNVEFKVSDDFVDAVAPPPEHGKALHH